MRKNVFTVGALDNLDYNPSSTTSVGSFYGTGISVMQSPTSINSGEECNPLKLLNDIRKCTVPAKYTTVSAVI